MFRSSSSLCQPSPNVWVDAYLAAHAAAIQAVLVTFEQSFTHYPVEYRILT